MSYKAGDILLVHLGRVNTSEIKGHEQGNTRPCIVIKHFEKSRLLSIVPVTKNLGIYDRPEPYYVLIIKSADNGLKFDSVALCNQQRTVSTKRVIKKMGELEPYFDGKIRYTLKFIIFEDV